MKIDTLDPVQLGDSTQWIRVRGSGCLQPRALAYPTGPWPAHDQRDPSLRAAPWTGEGLHRRLLGPTRLRSVAPRTQDAGRPHLELMVHDTVSLLELLRDRFDAKPHVAGFSLGATIGAYAAAQRPDLVATLVAVGTDIDGVAAGNSAYDFALQHCAPTCQPTRHPTAGGHRSAPAPGGEAVRHPGPLGLQLRRSDHQRDLRQRWSGAC